jgi:hypothetical protein
MAVAVFVIFGHELQKTYATFSFMMQGAVQLPDEKTGGSY